MIRDRQHSRVFQTSVPPWQSVWILLLLYGLTGTAWAWLNPIFEAPDEPFHVAYVNLLVWEHRWPGLAEVQHTKDLLQRYGTGRADPRIFEAGESEIFFQWGQPPLYYLVQTLPFSYFYPQGFHGVVVPANPDAHRLDRGFFQHEPTEFWHAGRIVHAVRAMRFVSVVLGMLVVWWTAQIATRVLPHSPSFPVLVVGWYAFIPMFSFMTAAVNNDVLAVLFSTVTLWVLIGLAQHSWSPLRAGALLGMSWGLGLVSKASLLYLLPVILVVSLRAYRRGADRWRVVSLVLGIAGIPFLAFYGLGVRPALHLDMLRYVLFGQRSTWFTFSGPFLGLPPGHQLSYLLKVLRMLGESFWGQFGWVQVPIDRVALGGYTVLTLLALVGWYWGKRGEAVPATPRREAMRVLGLAFATFLLALACYYRHVYVPQGGRHLFTVGPCIAVFFGLGLMRSRALLERFLLRPISEAGWAWSVVLCMMGLNWFVLWRSIVCAYARAWAIG